MGCSTTTAMYLNVSTTICASASASRSGNTVTVSGTFSVSQGNSWNYNAIYAYVDGHTSWTRVKPYVQSGGTWYADFSFSFTDSGSGNPTYTAIFQVWNNAETGTVGGSASTTFSVSYPSGATAPTGLWANSLVRHQEGFSMNVYISGWGGAGDSNSRYRELQCWTYSSSGLVTPRRWQPVYGNATSGTITVGNSSNGDLNIRGNTLYVLGLYASNGSYNTGSVRYDQATTLPYKDTLSVNKVWDTMADITYSVPSDGGRYDKTLQYSLDGTNWTTYDTISGGSAKSSSFILMNLTPNTSYTLRSRVTTNNAAYIVNNDNLTVATLSAEPTITQESATNNSVLMRFSFAADGGAYDKTIVYTIDGGAHWITAGTVTGSGAVFGTFEVENLQPNTSYNLIVRITTGAGTITLDDMTITTGAIISDHHLMYGPEEGGTFSGVTGVVEPGGIGNITAFDGATFTAKWLERGRTLAELEQRNGVPSSEIHAVKSIDSENFSVRVKYGSVYESFIVSPANLPSWGFTYVSTNTGEDVIALTHQYSPSGTYTATEVNNFYGSVNGEATKATKVYGSAEVDVVSGVTGEIRTGGIGNVTAFDADTFWSSKSSMVDKNKTPVYLWIAADSTQGSRGIVLERIRYLDGTYRNLRTANMTTLAVVQAAFARDGITLGSMTDGGDYIDLTPSYSKESQAKLIHQGFGHITYEQSGDEYGHSGGDGD